MPEYEKLQSGDVGYDRIVKLRRAGNIVCDAIDHNEDVIRLADGRLFPTGHPHRGCSNPSCWKYHGARR